MITYVVQYETHHGNDTHWRDDYDHQPFEDYWEAVDAALADAKGYGLTYRVVERPVAPDDVEVYKVRGDL